MPFFVVARAHFSVVCGVCHVGGELCGKRSHGMEGARKALKRFYALGWTHELDLPTSDAAEWVEGLGAGRWRCGTCSRKPLPGLDAPPVARAAPGLLTFLLRDDGAVKWSREGDGDLHVASAGETGTGVAWSMAALPSGDAWAGVVSRRHLPYGYSPIAVMTGLRGLDGAATWCRSEVEADHARLAEVRAKWTA